MERKPRTKKQNPFFAKTDERPKCWYFDGFDTNGKPITECLKPWSNRCDGNQHNCSHLKMRYLASLSEKDRKSFIDKYLPF